MGNIGQRTRKWTRKTRCSRAMSATRELEYRSDKEQQHGTSAASAKNDVDDCHHGAPLAKWRFNP